MFVSMLTTILFCIFNRMKGPLLEKTNSLGFCPVPTKTDLKSHRSRLEA